MSIVINTKTMKVKDGFKNYYYLYVLYGENAKESIYCGSINNPKAWEKAFNKQYEILERELQNKIAKTKNRLKDYMQDLPGVELDTTTIKELH